MSKADQMISIPPFITTNPVGPCLAGFDFAILHPHTSSSPITTPIDKLFLPATVKQATLARIVTCRCSREAVLASVAVTLLKRQNAASNPVNVDTKVNFGRMDVTCQKVHLLQAHRLAKEFPTGPKLRAHSDYDTSAEAVFAPADCFCL